MHNPSKEQFRVSNQPKVDVFRPWEEADVSEKTDTWRTWRFLAERPEPGSSTMLPCQYFHSGCSIVPERFQNVTEHKPKCASISGIKGEKAAVSWAVVVLTDTRPWTWLGCRSSGTNVTNCQCSCALRNLKKPRICVRSSLSAHTHTHILGLKHTVSGLQVHVCMSRKQ